jgi:predicted flavoprotein YhiN
MNSQRVVVAGGGAAGFFAAITCAEAAPDVEVVLLEKGPQFLSKVRISGGGRCNVTHACFEPREFAAYYPRGGQGMIGLLQRFQASDTVAWFEQRGVRLKTERDGRMFPVTDSSQTVIDCLLGAATAAGVKLHVNRGVEAVVKRADGKFELILSGPELHAAKSVGRGIEGRPLTPSLSPSDGERVPFRAGEGLSVDRVAPVGSNIRTSSEESPLVADRLLMATGGCRAAAMGQVAVSLGHTLEPPVPSLFTFHIETPWLRELAGVSVEDVAASLPGSGLQERGAVLLTHWGVSGPAILRLSAWGARELHRRDYRFPLRLNWLPRLGEEALGAELQARRDTQPARLVVNSPISPLSARLWERLVLASGVGADTRWSALSRTGRHNLIQQLLRTELPVSGKSLNKDEFVTCGGVRLSEVNFKTMESRLCPGLYFGGELLDIDGLTGGFNFQAAWTTGWTAGRALAGIC